jgi:hypothetical protein
LDSASGEWIFITNDDTEFLAGIEEGFLEGCVLNDVLVVPAEIDNPELGKRAPVIGQLTKNGTQKELLLMDFAFIRASVFKLIGRSDENLDWYGAGLDRAILIALQDNLIVGVVNKGTLTHHLELENRTPPHSIPDFRYLRKKWMGFQRENGSFELEIYNDLPKLGLPIWFYSRIWPVLFRLKTRILKRV